METVPSDWALFQKHAALEKLFSVSLDVNEQNKKFTECIIAAAHLAIPQTSGIVRRNGKTWNTKECREAKKKQNKAWGIFRRYPTQENLIKYKKARAKARNIRRDAEKRSWQGYVSSINSSVTAKKMWEQVRKLDGKFSPFAVPFLTPPDAQTSILEQADLLGEHFSHVSSSLHYTDSFLKYKNTAEKQRLPTNGYTNEPYNNLITVQELHRVLTNGKKTAPGPDEIHYEMLAICPNLQ